MRKHTRLLLLSHRSNWDSYSISNSLLSSPILMRAYGKGYRIIILSLIHPLTFEYIKAKSIPGSRSSGKERLGLDQIASRVDYKSLFLLCDYRWREQILLIKWSVFWYSSASRFENRVILSFVIYSIISVFWHLVMFYLLERRDAWVYFNYSWRQFIKLTI